MREQADRLEVMVQVGSGTPPLGGEALDLAARLREPVEDSLRTSVELHVLYVTLAQEGAARGSK